MRQRIDFFPMPPPPLELALLFLSIVSPWWGKWLFYFLQNKDSPGLLTNLCPLLQGSMYPQLSSSLLPRFSPGPRGIQAHCPHHLLVVTPQLGRCAALHPTSIHWVNSLTQAGWTAFNSDPLAALTFGGLLNEESVSSISLSVATSKASCRDLGWASSVWTCRSAGSRGLVVVPG